MRLAAMGAAKNIVVVLDPGHDDTHAGARRNGLEEERFNTEDRPVL